MKGKKFILFIILLLAALWVFRYFLGYIRDLSGVGFMVGIGLYFILPVVGVYQIIKLVIEKEKHFERLTYSLIIFALLTLIYFKPRGLVNWENFEAENYLVATMRGNVLKLKPRNKFKFISGNMNFYFGTYNIENDTLFLNSKKKAPYMDKSSYAILKKTINEPIAYRSLCLYPNFETKTGRCITMLVRTVKMEKLVQ